MSIKSLIDVRVNYGVAPPVIWVIVGNYPKWIEDAPDWILIKSGEKNIDLRAVTGLHVDVFEIGNECITLDRVLNALDKAKPKSRGLVCLAGIAGLNENHETYLEKANRILCST